MHRHVKNEAMGYCMSAVYSDYAPYICLPLLSCMSQAALGDKIQIASTSETDGQRSASPIISNRPTQYGTETETAPLKSHNFLKHRLALLNVH